jgi:hypothetical protein
VEAGHDKPFKPAKDLHRKVMTDFEHKTDLRETKKSYRDSEGAVMTAPRNFTTSPIKKGRVGRNVYLGGITEYKEDPYNRKREFEKKEMERHHSMLQEKPFSNKVKGRETFFTNV